MSGHIYFRVSGGGISGDVIGHERLRAVDDSVCAHDCVRRSIDRRLSGGVRTVTWHEAGHTASCRIYTATLGRPMRRGGGFGRGGYATTGSIVIYIER